MKYSKPQQLARMTKGQSRPGRLIMGAKMSLFMLALVVSAEANAFGRTWTLASRGPGDPATIDGELIGIRDNKVYVTLPNNTITWINRFSLTPQDKQFIENVFRAKWPTIESILTESAPSGWQMDDQKVSAEWRQYTHQYHYVFVFHKDGSFQVTWTQIRFVVGEDLN